MNADALLGSLTNDELKFIAGRDYGADLDIHLKELRKLLNGQAGVLSGSQYWHPYEVIELTAHALVPGHEKEFVACTILVLRAVASGYDTSTDLDLKFNDRAQDYDSLPTDLRAVVLDAYVQAGIHNTAHDGRTEER